MSVGEIRNNYLLYIGAGCVATAGIISMARTLPPMMQVLKDIGGVEVPDTLAKFGSGSDGGNGTPVAQRPSS